MSYLRKLAFAAIAVCAVLAIGAASASAARPLPAPPWDDDPTHWTGVEVTDCWSNPALPGAYPNGTPCTVNVTVPDLELTQGSSPPLITCDVSLTIDVWQDGETEITFNGAAPGNPGCVTITANNQPWDDQICERIADDEGPLSPHQYWDAIDLSFTLGGNTVAGVTYAQLLSNQAPASPLNPADSADIDDDIYGSGGGGPDFHLEALNGPFDFDQDETFDVDSVETDCAWSFPEA